MVMGQRAAPIVRRAGGMAARAALEERHTIAAVGSAALLGYAEKQGMLDTVPDPLGVGPVGTIGVVAWAFGRFGKNNTAAHVATGLLSVAAYKKLAE